MVDTRKSYAFVLPWPIEWVGGVNEVVRNLVEEFRLAGEYHVVVIESNWRSPRPIVERRPEYTVIRMQLRNLGLPGESAFKTPLMYALALPSTLRAVRRLSIEHRIEAFNIHFPSLDAVRWVLLRALGMFSGKVILSLHGSDIRSGHGMNGWKRRAYRFLLRRADAVVSCSAGLDGEVKDLEPRAKGFVVHNGIDASRFANEGKASEPQATQAEGEQILCIGRFEYRKAHDLLLRSFSELLVKRPHARLVL